MSTTNPLRQVYDELWTMLEAESSFTSLVEAGNRIKLNVTEEYPDKDEVSSADLPEVRVVCTSVSGPHDSTSNSSFLDTEWAIEMRSGDQGQYVLFDVIFAVYRAMRPWKAALMDEGTGLTWDSGNGTPVAFVYLCRTMKASLTDKDRDANRGIKGWSAAWRGFIRMHFETSEL